MIQQTRAEMDVTATMSPERIAQHQGGIGGVRVLVVQSTMQCLWCTKDKHRTSTGQAQTRIKIYVGSYACVQVDKETMCKHFV